MGSKFFIQFFLLTNLSHTAMRTMCVLLFVVEGGQICSM